MVNTCPCKINDRNTYQTLDCNNNNYKPMTFLLTFEHVKLDEPKILDLILNKYSFSKIIFKIFFFVYF